MQPNNTCILGSSYVIREYGGIEIAERNCGDLLSLLVLSEVVNFVPGANICNCIYISQRLCTGRGGDFPRTY